MVKMMLFLSDLSEPPAAGLSTLMPLSSMKLVVEMKKMSRNMITSMRGMRFSSIGSSGWERERRSFMAGSLAGGRSTLVGGEAHVLGPAKLGFVDDTNHH